MKNRILNKDKNKPKIMNIIQENYNEQETIRRAVVLLI
jgi:hypothetical protein